MKQKLELGRGCTAQTMRTSLACAVMLGLAACGSDPASSSGGSGGTTGGTAAGTPAGGTTGGTAAGTPAGGTTGGTAGTTPVGGSTGGTAVAGTGVAGTEIINSGMDCPKPMNNMASSAGHVMVNVMWPATTGLIAGMATMHLWNRADLTFADDGTATGTVHPCGSQPPEFEKSTLAGGGKVKIEFPEAAFDSPMIPTGTATGMLTPPMGSDSPFAIGATIMMDPVGLNIGIRLTDPINDPWLTKGMGSMSLSKAVDDDGDGSPGLTAIPLKDATHGQPPISLVAALPPFGGTMPAGPFADKLYLVIRLVVQLMGVRDSCMTATGTANVMKLDTRVVGCHKVDAMGADQGECAAADSDFIDANQADMMVVDAKYEMQVVPATTTCAEIRQMLPAM